MRQGCRIVELEDITAIMCGGEPINHKCDDEGEILYEFSDGFQGSLFEKTKQEKLNLNMCDEDKFHFLRKRDINIRSASVSCSICGRAAISNAYFL